MANINKSPDIEIDMPAEKGDYTSISLKPETKKALAYLRIDLDLNSWDEIINVLIKNFKSTGQTK